MNDLDEATFKRFLTSLHTRAMRSPYAIGVSSITFAGMAPYFIYYGFGNWWFTAGLALWVIASIQEFPGSSTPATVKIRSFLCLL